MFLQVLTLFYCVGKDDFDQQTAGPNTQHKTFTLNARFMRSSF